MATLEMPRGSFPTMITPFTESGEIDWGMLDRLIEWYITAGAVGLFSPCLSSEFYNLSDAERLELAQRVHQQANGRVKVVATGTYGGTIESQASFCRQIAEHCDAVVVVTCHLAAEEDEDATWLANAQKLLDLTEGIPLGLYECPVPYKRLLSPSMLRWAALSKRFFFHKDTCCDVASITAKVRSVQSETDTGFRFFNANVETLVESLQVGGHGFCGISANFYPQLHSFVCQAQLPDASGKIPAEHDESLAEKVRQVQAFLSVAENVVVTNYPASAKVYLKQFPGMEALSAKCRTSDFVFNEQMLIKLRDLRVMAEEISARVGLASPLP